MTSEIKPFVVSDKLWKFIIETVRLEKEYSNRQSAFRDDRAFPQQCSEGYRGRKRLDARLNLQRVLLIDELTKQGIQDAANVVDERFQQAKKNYFNRTPERERTAKAVPKDAVKIPKLTSADQVGNDEYVITRRHFDRLYGWRRAFRQNAKAVKPISKDTIKQQFNKYKSEIHKHARRFSEGNNLLKQYVAVSKVYYEEMRTEFGKKARLPEASQQIKADEAVLTKYNPFNRDSFIAFVSKTV